MNDFIYTSEFYNFHFEDEVLRLTYVKGPISLEIAKQVVQKRLELTQNEDVLLLVDDEGLKSIDRDARDYLSSDAGIAGIKAAALLSSSYFSRHLANFFLKISVNKPKIPARVFSDEEEAKVWLKQFD